MTSHNRNVDRNRKKIRNRASDKFKDDEYGSIWNEREVITKEDRSYDGDRLVRKTKYLKVKSRPYIKSVGSEETIHKRRKRSEESRRQGSEYEYKYEYKHKRKSKGSGRRNEFGEAGGKKWRNVNGKKEWKEVGEKSWHRASDREWREFMTLFREYGGRKKRWGDSGSVEWRDVDGRREYKRSGRDWKKAGDEEWTEIFGNIEEYYGGGGGRRQGRSGQRDGGIREWGEFRDIEWRILNDGQKELRNRDDGIWKEVSNSEFEKTIGKEWRRNGGRFPRRYGVEEIRNIEWREIDGTKEYRKKNEERWREADWDTWEELGGKTEWPYAEKDKRKRKELHFREEENEKTAEYEERKANLAREEKFRMDKSFIDHKQELVDMEKKRVSFSFDNERERLDNLHEVEQKKISEERANLEQEAREIRLREEREGQQLDEEEKRAIDEDQERLHFLEVQKKEELKREQDVLDQMEASRLRELEAEKIRLASKLEVLEQQSEGEGYVNIDDKRELRMDDKNNVDGNADQTYYLSHKLEPTKKYGSNVQKKVKDYEKKEREIAEQVARDRKQSKRGGKKHPKVNIPARVRLGW